MTDNVNDLVLDLLQWLGSGPRPYAEVLEAWRTSCPRLPVWEEANERGFIERVSEPGAVSSSRCPAPAPSICTDGGATRTDCYAAPMRGGSGVYVKRGDWRGDENGTR